MGVNLFVEGSPSPIVIRVTLPRKVSTFREIGRIADSLGDIDHVLRSTWWKVWPSYRIRRNRDISVLHFRVDSPPSFEILSDPAWLAVFLIAITGYKQGKESVAEMTNDLSSIASGIKVLTMRQIELLEIAVHMGLELCWLWVSWKA